MPYLGNQHNVGDHVNNFKVLDDISSYTATFDGSAASVISTADETIRIPEHRFIQGQRVTYTNGGGGNIGGLTTGTAYFVSFDSANTIKLATTLANANSNTVINLSSVGSGTSHTLNAAFDGVNTKFKVTYRDGKEARFNNATQLNVAINNVIQRPNQSSLSFTEGFVIEDNHKIVFKVAPTVNDIFWGSIIANTIENFDLQDNEIDNFTGDGSTTEFTLSTIPANNESVVVSIDGVLQHPSDKDTTRAYTLIDSILQFTAAPASNAEIQARHIGFAGATTADVSGFYGRTGNVTLTTGDNISVGDISTSRNINATGIVTAASFRGDGSQLTGIDATALKDTGGNVKIQAQASGAVHTGIATFNNDIDVDGHTELDNLNVTGVSTFAGDASFAGNVSIGGTLTYEDVTNVDAVGLATFRDGIVVQTGTATTALIVEGNARVTGILTIGTGSLTITDRDINAVGVVTGSNFKTGTSNVHNVGIEVAQINVLGGPTKIGSGVTITNDGNYQSLGISTALQFKTGTTNVHNVGIEVAQLNVLGGDTKIGSGATIYADGSFQAVGIATAKNFKTGTTNVHNVGVELAGINVLGADTPIGTGATIFNTGQIVAQAGAEIAGIVTANAFRGDGSALTGLTAVGTGAIGGLTVRNESGNNVGTAGSISTIDFNGSSGVTVTAASGAAGIATVVISAELVSDTSPQLGGNLDLNSKTVNGSGTINLTGSVTATSFVGPLTGNAATATKLATARTIGGTSFDGTANIVPAQATNSDTVDNLHATSFLRSDANDTASGQISLTYGSSYPLDINGANDAKMVLRGSSNPYIRFREADADKAYIQWNASGWLQLYNQEDSSGIRIKDDIVFTQDGFSTTHKIWHAGNDGSGSGLDSDTLDGVQGSNYLRKDVTETASNRITFSSGSLQLSSHYFQGYYSGTTNYIHLYPYGTSSGNASVTNIRAYNGSGADTFQITGGSATGLKWRGYTVWTAENDGSGSTLDADTLDGSQASAFPTLSGSNSFTNSYNEFGNSTGSVSNDGSWNARLNLAGSSHARLDVKSVSDGIITTMYAHSGHAAGRVGTYSNHKLILMANAQNRAELSTSGSLSTTVQGTLWGASNDGSGSGLDADLWDGNQFSTYLNQALLTSSGPSFANVYCNGWFRSNDSGDGLYNTATGQHFYSDNDDYWNVAGGSSANGIRFRDEHAGTIRGYIYANSSNEIGLLDGSGNWNIRTTQSGLTKIGSSGYQFVNGNNANNIYFKSGNAGGDIGISGYNSNNDWKFQLYGASGYYGFLDANWGGWDIQKQVNGAFKVDEGSGLKRVINESNLSSYASSSSVLYIDVYSTGSTSDRNTANGWAQSAVSIPNDCLYIVRYYYTHSYWVGNHTGTSHEDRRTVFYKNSSGTTYWAGVDRS